MSERVEVSSRLRAIIDIMRRVNRGVLGCSLYAVALPDGVDILTINNEYNNNVYNE